MILIGCTSLQDAAAIGETRTLSFQHTHRDDGITVTFKRDGRYDEDGLKKLNYFLRDWRNDEQTKMDPRLFDILWEISREVGAKEPIHIISSYRSPQTNAMLRRRSRGVAQYSQHTLGNAIDFFIPGVSLEQLRIAGLRQQRGGVGYYPTSGSPFVHVDVGGVRHWPRMTHDQLARVFPDGKTVHIPSDGTPLKNYQLALADVQRRGGTPSEMSLTAARNAGIQTGEPGAVTRGGGNFLAKLLGLRTEEDEDAEAAAPRARQPASAPAPARHEVAAVPLPRARPTRPGEFTLASASTSAARTPADLAVSRGLPDKDENASAAPPAQEVASAAPAIPAAEPDQPARPVPQLAVAPSGERLAWITGPESRTFPPRPPRNIEGVAVAAADTASIAEWASNPGQNDRVPSDLALAYAANPPAEEAASAAAAPMGSLRPAATSSAGNATIATRKPAANSPAAKIAPRGMDPWLRGIVMTPSVHHSLRVATVGAQDTRTLRPLLHKPRTTLAMVFSNDPLLGLTSVQFSGPAVAFLPTISHTTTRTAGLN